MTTLPFGGAHETRITLSRFIDGTHTWQRTQVAASNPEYMDFQQDINPKMRAILVRLSLVPAKGCSHTITPRVMSCLRSTLPAAD